MKESPELEKVTSNMENDEIRRRKQAAKDAGYDNPMCASCGHMETPANKVCQKCMSDTPMFNVAVTSFLNEIVGTKQRSLTQSRHLTRCLYQKAHL